MISSKPETEKSSNSQTITRDPNQPITLMIAEKDSMARIINKALSKGKNGYRKGLCQYCPVYEFKGEVLGETHFVKMTSVAGHIFTLDFPIEYNDWRKVEPLALFEAPTLKKEANPSANIISHLQAEAKDASCIVLWLDNDREGENICFEVLECIKDSALKNFKVYRAKISSTNEEEIVNAFKNLKNPPNLNESLAVDARQIIDLKIGSAFSRLQSMYIKKKFPNLDAETISYGPCQTPALNFCVERELEKKSLDSEKNLVIESEIAVDKSNRTRVEYFGDRITSKNSAITLKQNLINKSLEIEKITEKSESLSPPCALNTLELLKISSIFLKFSPKKTLELAEVLYLKGFITYPRTETSSYPKDFEFQKILKNLETHETYKLPKGGNDVGDHPPITPTAKLLQQGMMTQEESMVYDIVVRSFFASISSEAKLLKRTVYFKIGSIKFKKEEQGVADLGFLFFTNWRKYDNLFNFDPKSKYEVKDVLVSTEGEKLNNLNESELISCMEKYKIGTDASISSHINNLTLRKYVDVREEDRALVPTKLGTALISGYKKIDKELVGAELRGTIESYLDQIAKGKSKFDDVLKKVLEIFKKKYLNFNNLIPRKKN